jgi:NADP-dependent 3-hydroxy acid dehydrogenase YdfG
LLQSSIMKLANSVVVITGAESDRGRAAALRLAKKGARLVRVARPGDALAELSARCERAGAPHAIAAPGDVTEAGVRARIAAQTVDAFGHIDLWLEDGRMPPRRKWLRRFAYALGAAALVLMVRRLGALDV